MRRRIERYRAIGRGRLPAEPETVVATRAAAAGPEGDFAGHSLRAGFATAAARAGRSEAAIMRHGRWKSVQIARRYIRRALAGTITPRPSCYDHVEGNYSDDDDRDARPNDRRFFV